MPQVKVVKKLPAPTTDTGKFDFTQNGVGDDNGGVGLWQQRHHRLQERAVATTTPPPRPATPATDLGDYVSTWSWANDAATTSGTGTAIVAADNLDLGFGAQVTCTFTNHRKPQIKVVKDVVPNSDTGTFELSIDATSYDNMVLQLRRQRHDRLPQRGHRLAHRLRGRARRTSLGEYAPGRAATRARARTIRALADVLGRLRRQGDVHDHQLRARAAAV